MIKILSQFFESKNKSEKKVFLLEEKIKNLEERLENNEKTLKEFETILAELQFSVNIVATTCQKFSEEINILYTALQGVQPRGTTSS